MSKGAKKSALVMTLGRRASSAVVVTHSKAAKRNRAKAMAWIPENAPPPKRWSGVLKVPPTWKMAMIESAEVEAKTT